MSSLQWTYRWIPKSILQAQGYYQGQTSIWVPKCNPLPHQRSTTSSQTTSQIQITSNEAMIFSPPKLVKQVWLPKKSTIRSPTIQEWAKLLHQVLVHQLSQAAAQQLLLTPKPEYVCDIKSTHKSSSAWSQSPISVTYLHSRTSELYHQCNIAHIRNTSILTTTYLLKDYVCFIPMHITIEISVRNEQTQPLQQMPLDGSRQLLTRDTQGFLAPHSLPMHQISMHKVGSIRTLHEAQLN